MYQTIHLDLLSHKALHFCGKIWTTDNVLKSNEALIMKATLINHPLLQVSFYVRLYITHLQCMINLSDDC